MCVCVFVQFKLVFRAENSLSCLTCVYIPLHIYMPSLSQFCDYTLHVEGHTELHTEAGSYYHIMTQNDPEITPK